MANKLTDMSKIRKVIKYHLTGKSKLFISNYLSLSRNTVKKYISLFDTFGMNLEDIAQKTDAELETLFSQTTVETTNPTLEKLYSYFPKMERDLKKVGMSVQHLWESYYKENPDGLKSSQFRHHFRIWSNRVKSGDAYESQSGR